MPENSGPWRAALLAAALAVPVSALIPANPAEAAGQRAASARTQAGTQARPTAGRHHTRPQGATARHGRRTPRSSGPRLPDAPQELLPAAMPGQALAERLGPRAACLAAARRAEQVHGLPQGLLVAVALSESGLHAHALSIRGRAHFPSDLAAARQLLHAAPAHATVMAGCVQVNARVHARGSDWPLDPVRSADWAGGILRRWHQETGSWTEALRRWHGGSARSSHNVVCRVRAKLEVTAPESGVLADYPCNETEIARQRRNGAVLLEVAEMP